MTLELIDKEDCIDNKKDIWFTNRHKRDRKRCFFCHAIDDGTKGHSWIEYIDFGRIIRHYVCYSCRSRIVKIDDEQNL